MSPEQSHVYTWVARSPAFLSKPDSHPQASSGPGELMEPHRSVSTSSASQQMDSLLSSEPRRSCSTHSPSSWASGIPHSTQGQAFILTLFTEASKQRRQALHPQVMCEHSVESDPLRSRGLQPSTLLCPWDSPGRNTRAGCHSLLWGIFLTQGSDPGVQPASPASPPLAGGFSTTANQWPSLDVWSPGPWV